MKPRQPPNRPWFDCAVRLAPAPVCLWTLLCFLPVTIAPPLRAQAGATNAGTGFQRGAREIFSLNLAQETLGDFPRSLRHLSGTMEVVEKDGQRMLRASSRSEFLINLPERLPDKFTLEFDLITRASGYNNDELAFEGTATMNRSPASAHVMWYQGSVTVLGGGRDGSNGYLRMPDDVQAEIEGQLAEIRVEFNGDNFKLYTNGRRLLSFPDLKFVRARVLRVLLGGVDPNQYALHLARLRIADATTTQPATAQQQSGIMAANPTSTGPASSNSGPGLPNPSNPSGSAALALTGLTVSLNASGAATVTWNPLPVPATYFVVRWNADDPGCCNAMSLPGLPLRSPVWQDGVLPVRGNYVYRVIAKTASGTLEAETRYAYGAAPTPPPPPGVAAGAPAVPVSVTPPAGAIASLPAPAPAPTPAPGSTATGSPRTGTIVTPTPAPHPPPSPASSGPRTVSVVPTTPAPTAATPTITALPAASPTATGMVITPRYQVLLTGFAVAKVTNDDPLNIDGRGDEAFGAAAVVNWNRQSNQLTSYAFVQTRDYGDASVRNLFPDRIQAGSATGSGGLAVGDRVPGQYDVTGANLPPPATDQFPLLVWEGELNPGVEAVVIAPSLWERDTVRTHFNNYRNNWGSVSADHLLGLVAVNNQYASPGLTSALVPLDRLINVAPPAPTFNSPATQGYKIAALAFGPSSDRPIGMGAAPGVLTYQERVMLLTREKVNTLGAGDGVTIAVPFAEPIDIALNGIYTLYVRVQRIQ